MSVIGKIDKLYIKGEYDLEQAALIKIAVDQELNDDWNIKDGCCGCSFDPFEIAVLLRRAGLRVVKDRE